MCDAPQLQHSILLQMSKVSGDFYYIQHETQGKAMFTC